MKNKLMSYKIPRYPKKNNQYKKYKNLDYPLRL